jgi:hypothetical protein
MTKKVYIDEAENFVLLDSEKNQSEAEAIKSLKKDPFEKDLPEEEIGEL